MDTYTLTRRLNSIGKAAFVKHFSDFKAYAGGQLSKEGCIDKIVSAGTSNWDGANIRCSNAKLIFDANKQNQALQLIVSAKKIPNDIIRKAKNLLGWFDMLTLDAFTKEILKQEQWKVFDLHMTPEGFNRLDKTLARFNQTAPQVYIHVCDEGVHRNQVLRIGKAEAGVYKRWITSTDGHQNTFFWAIDESDGYKHQNASRYPLYLLFFASLYSLKTKLYVLTCQNGYDGKIAARASEVALIGYYKPIWERYKNPKKINGRYPNLTGKSINKEIHASVTSLGGALKAIENQRNGRSLLSHPIPDVMDMNIGSGKFVELLEIL